MCMNLSVFVLWLLITLALSAILTVFVMLKLSCDDVQSSNTLTSLDCLPSSSMSLPHPLTTIHNHHHTLTIHNHHTIIYSHYIHFFIHSNFFLLLDYSFFTQVCGVELQSLCNEVIGTSFFNN